MAWLDLVPMFKALGDPTRARIFAFLCSRSAPVAVDEESGDVRPVGCTIGEVCCHITGSEAFSSTVSFHLKELRIAGLIQTEKQGRFIICSVNRDALRALQQSFQDLQSIEEVCK